MREALVATAALAALACQQPAAAQPMPKDAAWSLRLPKDEKVAYRGVVSFEGINAGGLNGMLYPAPNLLIGLAAVLTHAVVADSAQENQRRQIQENADRILGPYQQVLADYRNRELMQRGLGKLPASPAAKLLEPDGKPEGEWVVHSLPVFAMAQDERAIILDNVIVVYAPGGAETPTYQNVVRVVSHPRDDEHPRAAWIANFGEALKEEGSTLFAYSLQIALGDAAGPKDSKPQRTYRYMEGGTERMERAELVHDQCSRLVVRNLRGWLLSVPARNPPRDCKP